MINLDFELAFNKLVGEIPQVYNTFIHHFGEERVDLIMEINNNKVSNSKEYEEFLKTLNWQNIINNAKNTSCNKFTLVKLNQFVIDNKLQFTEENLKDETEESILEIIYLINYLIKYYYEISSAKIIIHFPKVTITNENDKSIDIFDLYAKVKVNKNGTIYRDLEFCKATYTEAQWNCKYIHSHIQSVSNYSPEEWKSSCLGGGPLSQTIPALRVDSNIDLWPLFCLELERYVAVESLKGGPYKRLETISIKGTSAYYDNFVNKDYYHIKEEIQDLMFNFIKYIISQKTLNFIWAGDSYKIGEGYIDTTLKLSNTFIEYFNNVYIKLYPQFQKDLILKNKILLSGLINKNKVEYKSDSTAVTIPQDKVLFKFKNQDIKLNVIKEANVNKELPLFLDPHLINSIVSNLTTFINYADQYDKLELSQEEYNSKKGIAI